MHCHICDGPLGNDEIKHTPEYGKGGFAPCGRCLEVIGELFNDDSEEEIDQQLAFEFYNEGIQDVTPDVPETS